MGPVERLLCKCHIQTQCGCWNWTGTKTAGGYGLMSVNGRTVLVHRFSYTSFIGGIPEGLHIDHLCRNRGCANPWHMEPVTQAVNTLRGDGVAARNKRKTHCLGGHEFSAENTRILSGGRRVCVTCSRVASNKYKSTHRASRSARRRERYAERRANAKAQ